MDEANGCVLLQQNLFLVTSNQFPLKSNVTALSVELWRTRSPALCSLMSHCLFHKSSFTPLHWTVTSHSLILKFNTHIRIILSSVIRSSKVSATYERSAYGRWDLIQRLKG
jgi:hypothetical protein